MAEKGKKIEEPPREAALVAIILGKYIYLLSALAGGLALILSRSGGCEWPQAWWRCGLAAVCSALAGMLFIQPLMRALEPVPIAETQETQPKPTGAAPAPGGVAPQEQPTMEANLMAARPVSQQEQTVG